MEDNQRTKIINSATELFSKQGYDGTSIRQICAAAGANVSMVSYYFGGKKELYQQIIDDLMVRQKKYMDKFVNSTVELDTLSMGEKIDLFKLIIGKMMDFLHSGEISHSTMVFFLREQTASFGVINSPVHAFAIKLLSSITGKAQNSKEVLLTLASIMGSVSTPRLVPQFTLKLLGQNKFDDTDMSIMKNNVFSYIDCVLGGNK